MQHVAISYRDEGNGKGAFFDHTTLRNMTGWYTKVVASSDSKIDVLGSFINTRESNRNKAKTDKEKMPYYGLPIYSGIPPVSLNDGEYAAFLFIPGYCRDSDKTQSLSHRNRLKYEQNLINKAMYRGQPILAVCAGAWTLWEAYGGSLVDVRDHTYSRMPCLNKNNSEVGFNVMIHRVEPVDGTFLSQAMGVKKNSKGIPVNSVHWQAVNPKSKTISKNVQISAKSLQDDDLAPNSRQSEKMQPDKCVEAFETIHGVPMMGIQWHPEAFNPGSDESTPHQGIFKTMQTAGMTYLNRRELNKEFTTHWKKNAYSSSSFFKPQKTQEHVCHELISKPN